MIRFEQFGWRFSDAACDALDDVSLEVGAGEFVAVSGPSGSGKTTLALALCGLLMGRQEGAASGRVCVDGHDVASTPLHEIAQTVGLVQQNPETHFATLTVADEIAFAMENRCRPASEIRRASDEALDLLAIGHLRHRDLATLSGGEKQRVAVASLMAGRPAMLVLDEPTASLDLEAAGELFKTLAELCRRTGLTVIIIEHKLTQLLPLGPRLIRLEEGRVTADEPAAGAAEEIEYSGGATQPARRNDPSRDRKGAVSPPPLVEVSNVTVEHDGHKVLDDISLSVAPGEIVAVLGPNGGGKTTLLHGLLGLFLPARGTIRVCGQAVSPAAVSRLVRDVGLVFQNADHQLVAESVWREALFAVRNFKLSSAACENEATRLLERAGLADRRDDHPYRLSWGQKRRLNLISAILHRPRLLLLDEPFAGQDWENALFLLDAIGGVMNGEQSADGDESQHGRGAALIVTHEPRVVWRFCTRVVFLEGGRVTVDAPLPEAFERLIASGHAAYVPAEAECREVGPS